MPSTGDFKTHEEELPARPRTNAHSCTQVAALNGVTLAESGRTRALVIADLLQRLPVRLTGDSHDFVQHLAASCRECTNEALLEGDATPRSHELPCVVVDGPANHAGGLAPAGGDPTYVNQYAASGQGGRVPAAAEWAESGGRGVNGSEMMAGGLPIATGGVGGNGLVGKGGVGMTLKLTVPEEAVGVGEVALARAVIDDLVVAAMVSCVCLCVCVCVCMCVCV